MITLDTLTDWHPLSGSIVLRSSDDRVRRVRVYLNCMEPTPLFVIGHTSSDDGRPVKAPARFLCTMPAGLEELEFYAAGDVEIGADHTDRVVYYQSTEGETYWFDGDGESFTTIHERTPRNEALEWVQFQSEQNQKRMQAVLRAEMDEQLAAMREEYGRQTGVHGGEAPQHPKSQRPGKAPSPDGRRLDKPGNRVGVAPVDAAGSGVDADEPAGGEEEE
ncbi:MAG: hypothetical protein EOS05_12870 [Mesorhizobium sp.]|nr:MAG: hypothetical protein EOS05_12870 [Mesorhizobium sp.]